MENNDGSSRPYDPREALADVAASRASVADRLGTPWWYHPALGAITAAIVLVSALDAHNIVRLAIALAAAVGIGTLVSTYQRKTGMWVSFRNLGPVSMRWWGAYTAVIVVAVGIAMVPTFTDRNLPLWLALALTALTFVATIVLGRKIDDAMRDEIRSGIAPAPQGTR